MELCLVPDPRDGSRTVFGFRGRYQDRHIPKSAGFWWSPELRIWYTWDEEKARKLIERCGARLEIQPEARDALQDFDQAVEWSLAATTDKDFPKPEDLNYLPFQRAAIAYAERRKSILIADEMGLGKTIEAIGILNACENPPEEVLVVCPASLKINWRREMEKWLVRKYFVRILDSKTEVGAFPFQRPVAYIVNYDILDRHKELLYNRVWGALILDECHYIKNARSKRTRLVQGLRADRKIFLTGTPILNRPVELFTILQMLDPQRWRSFWQYAKRYCAAHRNRYGWDFSGASNLRELQERLRRTLMIRRLKQDVLTELPPKIRQVVELPPNGCEAEVRFEREAWEKAAAKLTTLKAAVAAAESNDAYKDAVRQLNSGVRAVFQEVSLLRHATALAKVPAVIAYARDVLESGSASKLVIFAHHLDVLEAIAEAFGGQAVLLTGETSLKARQEAVDRFQRDPSVKVFVGSIQAAGLGITLHASSHVIFAELDWVPGNMTQAEDRCHRIGQKDSVLVQHLVLDNSLDARIAKTLIRKQQVIERALDKGAITATDFALDLLDTTL